MAPKDPGAAPGVGRSDRVSELEVALKRQAERLRAVLEVGTAISSARDVDQLLGLVMDRLTALLGADASSLFMLDPEKQELWSRVVRGSSLKEIRLPMHSGIAGQAVSQGQSLLVPDAYADPGFNPEIDRLSGFRTRSIIAAPLRHVSGRILGVVEVLHREANAFGPEERALVEAVASQIAAVLDNVLLLEQLRAQNEKLLRTGEELSLAVKDLDLLYEMEKAVSSAQQQADLLDHILAKATSAVGAGAGSILLVNEDRHELYFKCVRGQQSEALVSMSLKSGQGIAGHVAATGETVRVGHAEDCPRFDRTIAQRLGVAAGSVLCVPIAGEDRVLGALELLNKPGGFFEADERLATLLAGQTARAILLQGTREEGERKTRLATVGQMLSGVLHDLRTPMTIISGYVELMAEEQGREERKSYSGVVQKQLDHVSAMTRETLAFARGEQELFLRKIYLQAFAKEVEDYLRRDFDRTGVELEVLPRYTGTARVDENKLRRVVYNIARNAVQAMPEGGKFVFSVDREGEDLVLRFQDSGPGIPPEIAGKVFQSFVSAGKRDGTGLGLAIVKKIVEEHAGTVAFQSKPGQGTTFEVRLPCGTPAD